MARLPIPGSDDGVWGNVLNDFLSVGHNADGTLKSSGLPISWTKDNHGGISAQTDGTDHSILSLAAQNGQDTPAFRITGIAATGSYPGTNF